MTLPKTIIFDLSEVFIAGLPGIELDLAERGKVPVGAVLGRFWGDHLWQLCRGQTTEEQYLTLCCREANWSLTHDDIRRAIRKNFERKVADMEPLLRTLHGRYGLALLSDHAREWVEHIRGIHPFLELFSHQFFSFEVGFVKAERAAFEHVLRQLGRTPAECLFIDDSAHNVSVATELGLPAIHFTNAAALVRELGRRNIL